MTRFLFGIHDVILLGFVTGISKKAATSSDRIAVKGLVAPGKVSKRYLLLIRASAFGCRTLEDTGWMIGGPDRRTKAVGTLPVGTLSKVEG